MGGGEHLTALVIEEEMVMKAGGCRGGGATRGTKKKKQKWPRGGGGEKRKSADKVALLCGTLLTFATAWGITRMREQCTFKNCIFQNFN